MVTISQARQQVATMKSQIEVQKLSIQRQRLQKQTAAELRARTRQGIISRQLQQKQLESSKRQRLAAFVPVEEQVKSYEAEIIKAEEAQRKAQEAAASQQRDYEIARKFATEGKSFVSLTPRQREIAKEIKVGEWEKIGRAKELAKTKEIQEPQIEIKEAPAKSISVPVKPIKETGGIIGGLYKPYQKFLAKTGIGAKVDVAIRKFQRDFGRASYKIQEFFGGKITTGGLPYKIEPEPKKITELEKANAYFERKAIEQIKPLEPAKLITPKLEPLRPASLKETKYNIFPPDKKMPQNPITMTGAAISTGIAESKLYKPYRTFIAKTGIEKGLTKAQQFVTGLLKPEGTISKPIRKIFGGKITSPSQISTYYKGPVQEEIKPVVGKEQLGPTKIQASVIAPISTLPSRINPEIKKVISNVITGIKPKPFITTGIAAVKELPRFRGSIGRLVRGEEILLPDKEKATKEFVTMVTRYGPTPEETMNIKDVIKGPIITKTPYIDPASGIRLLFQEIGTGIVATWSLVGAKKPPLPTIIKGTPLLTVSQTKSAGKVVGKTLMGSFFGPVFQTAATAKAKQVQKEITKTKFEKLNKVYGEAERKIASLKTRGAQLKELTKLAQYAKTTEQKKGFVQFIQKLTEKNVIIKPKTGIEVISFGKNLPSPPPQIQIISPDLQTTAKLTLKPTTETTKVIADLWTMRGEIPALKEAGKIVGIVSSLPLSKIKKEEKEKQKEIAAVTLGSIISVGPLIAQPTTTATKSGQNGGQDSAQPQIPITIQPQIPIITPIQPQIPEQPQVPRQTPRQIPRQTPFLRPRLRPKLPPKKSIPTISQKRKTPLQLTSETTRGFVPEIRRRGQWISLKPQISFLGAKKKAIEEVESTLAASFRIKKGEKLLELGYLPFGFTVGKREPFVGIQKRGRRLSRRSEVREILSTKRRKSKRTNWLK